ncbi:hypothetical protein D3C72_2434480 [compost metagenome]
MFSVVASGPTPSTPVRSPVALLSAPIREPPQVVKVSGRLLQVKVALLAAMVALLGTSTV